MVPTRSQVGTITESLPPSSFGHALLGWVFMVLAVVGTCLARPTLVPWQCSLLGVLGLLLSFKVMRLPNRRRIPYLFLWGGTNPRPFEAERRFDRRGWVLVVLGLLKIGLGAVLLFVAAKLDAPAFVKAWCAMAAILLAIPLGFADTVTGVWRWVGIPVERICPDPWFSRTVSEFWNTRWNMAFHFAVRDHIYRPIARRLGRGWALVAVFLFSGLVHEFVISFPASGGWGLPTLYFLLQGFWVFLEKTDLIRTPRWVAILVVVVPLPLLFHEPWLERVILPML